MSTNAMIWLGDVDDPMDGVAVLESEEPPRW